MSLRIIAGAWKGRRIEAPAGSGTRPTGDRVREAWMSAIQPYLPEAEVLDLFSGSGALGLEALSRGAASVTFVERSGAAIRTLRSNISTLGAEDRSRVVRKDALAFLEALPPGRRYTIALADPPYGGDHGVALVRLFERRPFADQLWLEHARDDTLPVPDGTRTRRYGDTALTSLMAPRTPDD